MKWKLSDWASVAEIASGIAVVVSLFFLILGINKNTEVTQASMFAGLVEGLNNGYEPILSDPELRRIWALYIGGNSANLSPEDVRTLIPIIVGRANLLDTALTMRNADLIGENEWGRFEQLICREYQRAVDVGADDIVMSSSTKNYRNFITASC
jgi:hypothetical protein